MVLKIPMENMRVICPDVGGGFGTKLFPYSEYVLAALPRENCARRSKWAADRADHFMGDAQGRANVTTRPSMALAEDGKFLGMDVDLMGDMGAYLSDIRSLYPARRRRHAARALRHSGVSLPRSHGVHLIPCRSMPIAAPGAPRRPMWWSGWSMRSARKLGMTPDAIRRKNFITPRAMPYKTATGKIYDSGDFSAHMKRAMEIANWKEFPKRAKAAKKKGLVRGIGLGTLPIRMISAGLRR